MYIYVYVFFSPAPGRHVTQGATTCFHSNNILSLCLNKS